MKDSTTYISYHEFEERLDIKSNFLAFQGLISVLKKTEIVFKVGTKNVKIFMKSS